MAITSTISFLGTGSGFPSADRFFSSTVLYLCGVHLLIDAGEPAVHLLRDRSTLIRDIDAVLITHGHVDHIGGIPALLLGAMLLGRTKALPIFLPEEMIAPLRAWICALYLTEEGLGFPLIWRAWKNAESEMLEQGISIRPYANRHLEQSYRSLPGAESTRPCRSYSLEITEGNFRVIFSGDLAETGELVPLVSKPTTVLICEMSHFFTSELVESLRGAPIDTLCLVHLSEEYAGDRSELKMQLETLLPQLRDVILPRDGEVLDF